VAELGLSSFSPEIITVGIIIPAAENDDRIGTVAKPGLGKCGRSFGIDPGKPDQPGPGQAGKPLTPL